MRRGGAVFPQGRGTLVSRSRSKMLKLRVAGLEGSVWELNTCSLESPDGGALVSSPSPGDLVAPRPGAWCLVPASKGLSPVRLGAGAAGGGLEGLVTSWERAIPWPPTYGWRPQEAGPRATGLPGAWTPPGRPGWPSHPSPALPGARDWLWSQVITCSWSAEAWRVPAPLGWGGGLVGARTRANIGLFLVLSKCFTSLLFILST